MPESESEKENTPAGTQESSAAEKRESEPDKKPGDPAASVSAKRPPLSRSGKSAIVLLSILCMILTATLFLEEIMPRLIERNVNWFLLQMAEGGGAEFRIKSISLSGAEVACKLSDTRDGSPRDVGGIGSFSIRFSPIPFLLDQTINEIVIENCDVKADYSDGSFSIPAYNIFAKALLSGEKKEYDDSPSVDDLNAVIPVKVGLLSVSGSLLAEARGEDDVVDILHIPYEIIVRPDRGLDWNKLDCSLSVHFATNAIQCRATYLHREKLVKLDLENFSLSTSAMPGTVRSALPRGLRAGISLVAKAEIELGDTIAIRENSSVDGSFTLSYRRPDGFRINTETPFSLKKLPDQVVSLTVGTINAKYDTIPFEVDGLEMAVSLAERTVKGGFRFAAADSEPAKFSIDGGLNSERSGLSLTLDNTPLIKAAYKGIDLSFRPDELAAEFEFGDEFTASADFACAEIQAGLDGAALDPEFSGLTAFLRPESFSANFRMDGGQAEASAELKGGELGAGFKGTNVALKSGSICAGFETGNGQTEFSARLTGGELHADSNGISVSFLPEILSARFLTSNDEEAGESREISAELRGGELSADLNGMTCSVEKLAFGASSDDGQAYKADAKATGFLFQHDAAGLTYDAPEIGLDAAYFDGAISGKAVCGDSSLSMPELNLLAKDLYWEFPFDLSAAPDDDGSELETEGNAPGSEEQTAQTEPSAAPRTGKIVLGDFELNGVQAASLDGTIRWDDAARAIRLKTDAKLLSIDGHIHADIVFGDAGVEAECGIDIPEQDADLSKDLAAFFPQFEEISCTGRLGGSAVYKLLPKTTTGNADFHIAGANVFIPDKKLEVRGIDLGFEIPEIATLKSAPGQTLSFKSVKYDRIETGSGLVTFRMEAPDTWQLENAHLNWCNGHIRLSGITYRPGQTKTEAVLYCDRLELPVFLTQIGLGQINGSGSINGTIPVVLVQKTDASGESKIDNIYFDDAFLFSTPGEDGVIKGEVDEALMDPESGIEMELSRDALKDFTYSWVRMRMQSIGPDRENLKLELQLDGRPNRALYYKFDENTASFMKSATPYNFQGIRLDTNINMFGKAMELVDYFQQIFSKAE